MATQRYWERFTDGTGSWVRHRGRDRELPPGEDLAALRSGLGRAAGTVPRMWPFYTVEMDDGRLRSFTDAWAPPVQLEAEHHALTLYGLHQQSQQQPMHVRDVGVGVGVRKLRQSEKFSEDAVNRRFSAAATATSLGELVMHLRGLVQQMRALTQPCPLDYTRLLEDLTAWGYPDRRQRVRRRWGLEYFTRSQSDDEHVGDER